MGLTRALTKNKIKDWTKYLDHHLQRKQRLQMTVDDESAALQILMNSRKQQKQLSKYLATRSHISLCHNK